MSRDTSALMPTVLVVGGGPVGLTLANLLGLYGVRTTVIEQGTALSERPRAVGTDFDCLRAWQAIGLADRLLPDMIPSGSGGISLGIPMPGSTLPDRWPVVDTLEPSFAALQFTGIGKCGVGIGDLSQVP